MKWYQWTDTGLLRLDAATSPNTAPPALRALAYGDGFFTTMAVHKTQVLWQRYHDARLTSHAAALCLYLPVKQRQRLWQAVTAFAKEDITHGIIKIIVARKAQTLRGYAYSPLPTDNGCDIWVGVQPSLPLASQTAAFIPLPPHSADVILQQPPIIAVCLTSQLANLPLPLAGLKTLNRLDSVFAAGELATYQKNHPDLNIGEGLVQSLSVQAQAPQQWVEGVISNIFYQLRLDLDSQPNTRSKSTSMQWYTPPITISGVRGTMRQVIIDNFANSAVPVCQRALYSSDFPNLKAMFFCNAVRGVIPVSSLIHGADKINLQVS